MDIERIKQVGFRKEVKEQLLTQITHLHTQVAKLEPEFLASPENDHAVFCSATAIMTNIDILLKLL